jgi:hypothetical protein
MNDLDKKIKNNKTSKDKHKKIKKNNKKPTPMKKLLSEIKPFNDHLKTLQADPSLKNDKKPS